MASAEAMVGAPLPAVPRRAPLSPEQKNAILAGVSTTLEATVCGRANITTDLELAGTANQLVAGVFVSLKRGSHLRACCGGLNERLMPLGKALHDATARSALDDVRFPPVSPSELNYLDIEVWILFNPRQVSAHGEERVHAVVTGGKHGLLITRGEARGLLLPGVAQEHNWDSRRFLEQVCVKAGLHPSVWKEDDTGLMTFEGEPIRAEAREEAARVGLAAHAPIGPGDLPAFAAFCRDNIVLMCMGATPNYYLFGAADGTVAGLVARVHLRNQPDPGFPQFQFSMRPGLPLQSTIFTLAQAAARTLAAKGFASERLDDIEVELTVLYDPAMHGTVRNPDLRGFDTGARALFVLERNKAGLVFDPTSTADETLESAAKLACVSHPASAGIYSMQTLTTETRVSISTAPRPVRGPAERPPAVAGTFYPAEPESLRALVDSLLTEDCTKSRWAAALVPHAGLRFSGRIAADVLKRIEIPRSVIVIGPKHTPHGVEWAVAPQRSWTLPGLTIQSDFVLARQLSQEIEGLELDAVAHQREHAIEVELPFLARLAPEARVVGIALGQSDFGDCMRFAEGLARVISGRADRPLLLISSDMNHFAADAENRRLDAVAMDALESFDPEHLHDVVTQNGISMCGLVPAVIVLETLRRLGGLKNAERVGYATSADVSGDTTRVVGYAGMLFV
jgi:AmmeMemoRadiSam system protein B/AmmeMemoRadiSam system protein A